MTEIELSEVILVIFFEVPIATQEKSVFIFFHLFLIVYFVRRNLSINKALFC